LSKIPEIFKNTEHQYLFETQGYVKIQFLDKSQIDFLNKTFDELHPQLPESGFVSGSYFSDYNYKRKASDIILEVFTPSYERIFKDYTAFGGSFLFKMPSKNSDLVLHQDWTIVDENKAVALNCWVPLCDTSIENGTLMVLPGAHNYNFQVHRAPTLNFFFTGNEDLIMQHLVPTNAKAGEAVILNQSLVHYSPPNLSGEIRKAITAGVKTINEPMLFFYHNQKAAKNELDVYSMEEDFLIRFDNFAKDIFAPPINGQYIKTIPYQLPKPDRNELENMIFDFLRKSGYKIKDRISEEKTSENILPKTGKSFFEVYTPLNILREFKNRLLNN
jgi:hypothetical protein